MVMRKLGVCFVMTFLAFFLFVSCIESPQREEQADNVTNLNEPGAQLTINASETETSTCAAEWICISSTDKAYRMANCTFNQRTSCDSGCNNGTCRVPSACEVGFKCKNDYEKGYQREDCSWIQRTKCDFGCENGECKPPENISNVSSAVQEPAVVETKPTLKAGENVVIGGNNTLSIYTIEFDRVKLLMNNQKTDWLSEGQSFQFRNGYVITVQEILFQAYVGGRREIVYKVN